MTDGIKIDIDGLVATITINRPERLNAIDLPAWLALSDAASGLARDPGVRCVVLRGAGERAFSSGADIKDFEAHRFDSQSAAQIRGRVRRPRSLGSRSCRSRRFR